MNNIFSQWLCWQFFEVPKEILKIWRNFLLFNLNYFSIPLLVKTFFSHWRKYKWFYGRGFDIGKYFEVFVSNLISRIFGAITRGFLIFAGLIIEILIFFAGLVVFLCWLFLPFFLIAGLIIGLKFIF